MKRTPRLLASAAVGAALIGGALVTAPAAMAAPIGQVIPAPSSGSVQDPFNIKTSALCPAPSSAVVGYISHIGSTPAQDWPSDTILLSFTDVGLSGLATTGLPASDNLQGIANGNGLTLEPGSYTLTIDCRDADIMVTGSYGQFQGQITVAGTGASATYAYAAPAAPASSTTLAVSPSGSASLGAPVTLTATVTSSAAVAGTVQFKDGGVDLGSPVAVSGGSASLTTSALAAGAHSLTAAFVPTNPADVAPSTSAATSYSVVAPATATTTTVSASPASPTTADAITLSASVSPAAAGTVTFAEGATVLGSAPASGGSASLTLPPGTVAAGSHSVTATFAPSDTSAYTGSSGTTSLTVGAFNGYNLNGIQGGGEVVTTTVDGGTLTLTAATTPVDLGAAALNGANTLFVTAPKDINPVTVTDTRAGSLGYSVSGVAGDFTGAGGSINSENLGWTPKIVGTPPSSVSVTAGAAVPAGAGVPVGTTSSPVAGLKASRTLATAASGASVGTVELGASLVLQAPTTTKAGTYSTTLVITAL